MKSEWWGMTCQAKDLSIEPAPRAVRRAGILTHPRLPASAELARDFVARLTAMGVAAEAAPQGMAESCWLAAVDCLIVLGGDGSIVRAARAVAGTGVPVLGINLGQLGFLAELQPADVDGQLEALARGEYRVERRALLRATLTRANGETATFDALNDAVMARGAKVRVIGVFISIDGQPFTVYRADGVIVATPTGSTAYALAVGGPIMAPALDNLLVVPVAPHLVPTRALVVPGSSAIRLEMGKDYEGVLAVDGQLDQPISGGDVVNVTVSPKCVGFVRFGPPADFYGTLFRRLRWASHNK